jgi:hypothetical protein
MTDEIMNLRALLEKSSDADLLREMIGFTSVRSIVTVAALIARNQTIELPYYLNLALAA